MATVQSLQHSSVSTASSFPTCSRSGFNDSQGGISSGFPAGLRVLVVDDDPICLKVVDKMLRKCLYEVTTCSCAIVALSMLRAKKGSFDLVISDVYMPDMDGFKLLECVGLEMDLPVIMMSADGETSVVMKGIKHGACDYLLKPVRIEELKNIWQHIIRKKNSKNELNPGSANNSDKRKKCSDDAEYASSVNEGTDCNSKTSKRKKETKEEDDDLDQENDDPTSQKKPRVVWSVELHQQFVSAVNQLGIDKAVPKRILEMMDVQGLTRENVASHLQKYRLYLRRLSGTTKQQSGISSSFGRNAQINFGSMDAGRFDLQAVGASGQISPQSLMLFETGLLGKLNVKTGLGDSGESLCLPATLEGVDSNSLNTLRYGHPSLNNQNILLQGFPTRFQLKQPNRSQPHIPSFGNVELQNDTSSGFPLIPQQLATATANLDDVGQLCGADNHIGLDVYKNALMIKLLQQQQDLHQQIQTPAPMAHQSSAQFHGRRLLNLGEPSFSNPLSTGGNPDCIQGNSLTSAGLGQVNPISLQEHGLSTCASNAYIGSEQITAIDYRHNGLDFMSGNSVCLPSNLSASSTLPVVTEGVMSLPGMKNSMGTPELFNTHALKSSSLNYCASNGATTTLNQSRIQGWESPKFVASQDMGKRITPTLSPCYSESYSRSQGLNLPGANGHIPALIGIAGKGPSFSNKPMEDVGCPKAVNDVGRSEQSTADSGPRFMDTASVLKKQEDTKPEENKFSVDGYQLTDVHVK